MYREDEYIEASCQGDGLSTNLQIKYTFILLWPMGCRIVQSKEDKYFFVVGYAKISYD